MKPFLIMSAALLLCGCSLSDMRTDTIKNDGVTRVSQARGRALLARVSESYGRAAFISRQSITVEGTDEWYGALGKLMKPWPHTSQQFSATFVPMTFTSQVTLIGGKGDGRVYGVNAWNGYVIRAGGESEQTDDDMVMFFLPAWHYFSEAPFRLSRAEYVAYAGEMELGGVTYDLVFATWKSVQPNTSYDQFLAWINRETLDLEVLQYTVRDVFRAAAGTIIYQDIRNVEGVRIPFRHSLYGEATAGVLPADTSKAIHRVTLTSAVFDKVPLDDLIVDPAAAIGDFKP